MVKEIMVVPDTKNIAGVVLAGGQSSRMGQSKALLDYNGQSLLDHMTGLLSELNLSDIYVSGEFDGYRSIPDRTSHQGPAWAMYDILHKLEHYDAVVFVPIDMPLLNVNALCLLMREEKGAYFSGFPLPVFITRVCLKERTKSVKGLLKALDVPSIVLPSDLEFCMVNTNTPEEWQEMVNG